MSSEQRTERYRKMAEGELQRRELRDPLLDQAIEQASASGSDLASQYRDLRTHDMLAAEELHEQNEARLRRKVKDDEESQPFLLQRTLLLIAVIVTVVALGWFFLRR